MHDFDVYRVVVLWLGRLDVFFFFLINKLSISRYFQNVYKAQAKFLRILFLRFSDFLIFILVNVNDTIFYTFGCVVMRKSEIFAVQDKRNDFKLLFYSIIPWERVSYRLSLD